ncbi:hypothetical protein HJG60_010439 [Phyllostomus discolor]|uniref:Uncharacterized protein n=1 Tax=Phyllostomus discolor TaxID=89673 RepID=A0A834AGT0_9CHIR|nr:hypothetical protein HJG60_010439 [Phyllostomus discolor]
MGKRTQKEISSWDSKGPQYWLSYFVYVFRDDKDTDPSAGHPCPQATLTKHRRLDGSQKHSISFRRLAVRGQEAKRGWVGVHPNSLIPCQRLCLWVPSHWGLGCQQRTSGNPGIQSLQEVDSQNK